MDMIKEYLFNCKKWRNIQYDFNKLPNESNCSLSIYMSSQVIFDSFAYDFIYYY